MTDEISEIDKRIANDKERVIEELKKSPIVSFVCDKTGVGRASYYRWRKEDDDFYRKTNEALRDSRSLVNDMAEAQLIKKIKEGILPAITFWLRNNHEVYITPRIVVQHKIDEPELSEDLIKEIDELMRKNSVCTNCKNSMENEVPPSPT